MAGRYAMVELTSLGFDKRVLNPVHPGSKLLFPAISGILLVTYAKSSFLWEDCAHGRS